MVSGIDQQVCCMFRISFHVLSFEQINVCSVTDIDPQNYCLIKVSVHVLSSREINVCGVTEVNLNKFAVCLGYPFMF